MEREFGISCPLSLPKDQYRDDPLDGDERESVLRDTLKEELQRAQSAISQVEEEKNKVGEAPDSFCSMSIRCLWQHRDKLIYFS